MLKHGISITLPVKFTGIDLDEVLAIEFLFKTECSETGAAVKTALYKSDGTGDAQRRQGAEGIIDVPWSKEDTYKFPSGKDFYMDTRITLMESSENPVTQILSLRMNESLFQEGDAYG